MSQMTFSLYATSSPHPYASMSSIWCHIPNNLPLGDRCKWIKLHTFIILSFIILHTTPTAKAISSMPQASHDNTCPLHQGNWHWSLHQLQYKRNQSLHRLWFLMITFKSLHHHYMNLHTLLPRRSDHLSDKHNQMKIPSSTTKEDNHFLSNQRSTLKSYQTSIKLTLLPLEQYTLCST